MSFDRSSRYWPLTSVVIAFAACADDDGWRQELLPSSPSASLSLFVSSDDDVWAGANGAWHYDGRTWSEHPLPVSTTIRQFISAEPGDVWAVGTPNFDLPGDQGQYALLHYRDQVWQLVPSTEVQLRAPSSLTGTSSSDLWVADTGVVHHYDGTTWTTVALDASDGYAMWAAAPTDVWLSGAGVFHYDGVAWSLYSGDPRPEEAIAFWGASTDGWAAAAGLELKRWDGTSWSTYVVHDDPEPHAGFEDVWGADANDVYAVGIGGRVAHYNGQEWNSDPILKGHDFVQLRYASNSSTMWASVLVSGQPLLMRRPR